MIRDKNASRIQKWFRKNRKNYDWWPVDSNRGSNWSYNKWLEVSESPNKKYNCCSCIIS